MQAQGNDVWSAEFTPPVPARYRCTVTAWVDHFESWRSELERRDDVSDIRVALQVGSVLVAEAAGRARGGDAVSLNRWASVLRENAARDAGSADSASLKALALDPARATQVRRYPDRGRAAFGGARAHRRPPARAIQQLVRIVSPVHRPIARAPRELQGRRSAPAVRGRNGVRRAVLSAHPADRPRPPQGRRITP